MYGAPSASAVTAAPFAITTAGVVTISQSPFNIPTQIQGAASQILRINSRYSNLVLEINNATIVSVNTTGVLMQTRYIEAASGITMVLGTQGSQPLVFKTNNRDWWNINPSGMLIPNTTGIDIGQNSGYAPRNVFVGGNMVWPNKTLAQITADQNDYQLGDGVIYRLSSDAERLVTGFATGIDGRFIVVVNVGGTNIYLPYEHSGSAAANRITGPNTSNATLIALRAPGGGARNSVPLYYDGTSSRWRAIGSVSSVGD